jgi:predicted MFS family arabinose efflux permease
MIGMIAHYTMVPNLSAYVQFNRGYPRDQLGVLYMIGGGFGFGTARLAGWLADRCGAPPVTVAGTTLYAAVLIVGFIMPNPLRSATAQKDRFENVFDATVVELREQDATCFSSSMC